MRKPLLTILAGLFAALAAAAPAIADDDDRCSSVRFATFNASLNRNAAGQLRHRPLDPEQRAGEDRRRDHPAHGRTSC